VPLARVPGSVLAGDEGRITEVEIKGLKVYLIGIDWEYLEKRAEAEGVLEPVRLLRAKVNDDEDA
jgi:hypothetical protein